jgi:hypothetical protein
MLSPADRSKNCFIDRIGLYKVLLRPLVAPRENFSAPLLHFSLLWNKKVQDLLITQRHYSFFFVFIQKKVNSCNFLLDYFAFPPDINSRCFLGIFK